MNLDNFDKLFEHYTRNMDYEMIPEEDRYTRKEYWRHCEAHMTQNEWDKGMWINTARNK